MIKIVTNNYVNILDNTNQLVLSGSTNKSINCRYEHIVK